jgi:hypothetical protein
MPSSGMLRRVALVRTDVFEERSPSFIKVTRIGDLGTTFAVTSNRRTLRRITPVTANVRSSPILVTLMKEALSSFETSVLTRATRLTSQKTAFLLMLRITSAKASKMAFELQFISSVNANVLTTSRLNTQIT